MNVCVVEFAADRDVRRKQISTVNGEIISQRLAVWDKIAEGLRHRQTQDRRLSRRKRLPVESPSTPNPAFGYRPAAADCLPVGS